MNEQGVAGPDRDLNWLLDDLADRVENFRKAVILSRDGLVIAATQEMGRENAEHLSALAAGLQSLARGAGEHFGAGEVRQSIIELQQALPVRHRGRPRQLPGRAGARGRRRRPGRLRDGDAGEAAGPHLASHSRFPASQGTTD